jgi:uracil-DNA glycosylase family 4
MEAAPAKGPVPCDHVFVGIAPSPNRPKDRYNEPFGARSWKFLQKILDIANVEIYVTNVIKIPQTPGKKPKVKVVRQYAPILMEELKLVAPKKILCLGTEPAKLLCPGFYSMREDHGTLFHNEQLNCRAVATYHLSSLGRDPTKEPWIIRDIQRFFELPEPLEPPYILIDEPVVPPEDSMVFLDIETTGTDVMSDKILSLGYWWEDSDDVYILDHPPQEALLQLRDIIYEQDVIISGHNLQFDLGILYTNSGKFWNVQVDDTMMLAHVWGEEAQSLKHLTSFYTDRPGSRRYGSFESFGYLAEDVLSTGEVYHHLDAKVGHCYSRELMNGLIPLATGMTHFGVHIDRSLLLEILPTYEAIVEEHLIHLSGDNHRSVNWKSPQQVAGFLLDSGVPLIEQTKSGNYSTAEPILKALAPNFPIVQALLDFRGASKFLEDMKDYYERTSEDHPILHPKMKLTGAVTGRTSCSDPNLQNVPRQGPVKRIFRSRWAGGHIGLLDLAQAELRMAGLLAADESFCEMLLQSDPHRYNASLVYGIPVEEVSAMQRKKSKAITFGLLYGGSPYGLSKRAGAPIEEVEAVLEVMFHRFPGLMRFINNTKHQALKTLEVHTPFGKRRDLHPIYLFEGPGGVGRKGINTPIQGGTSETALHLLWKVGSYLLDDGFHSRPLFGVHDSMVLDIYPGEERALARIAQRAFLSLNDTPLNQYSLWGKLPITGELIIGESWANVESTNEGYDPLEKFPCSNLEMEISYD